MDKLIAVCVIGLISLDNVFSMSEPNAFAPEIISSVTNSRGIPLFRGKIHEDETVVRMSNPLMARDNDTAGLAHLVCKYEIVSSRNNIPFEIEVTNKVNGSAVIKVRSDSTLSYAKRKHYKFNVFAYDCTESPYSLKSKRAVVMIRVEATDLHAPVFEQTAYNIVMQEDRLYDNLLQVIATDEDTGPDNGAICGYDLLSQDAPFVISNDGILKNTEKVYHNIHYNFILKIQARDCSGLVSKPAFINIQVQEPCKNAWTGLSEHLEYNPGSGRQLLSDKAHLSLCAERECMHQRIIVKMELATKHIGKGCDRDTYNMASQRKLCGARDSSIELLPNSDLTLNWTKAVPHDDGNEGDRMYAFDGLSNAVVVPDNHVDHRLNQQFTISTWMKHTFPNTVMTQHKNGNKENILCMSDGDGMNRHHYALFVHNEKLIFLLRQDNKKGNDLEKFQPAEWRWTLPEVNDGRWHHYALSMDYPQMLLYVDGKQVDGGEASMEILDDWPLHPTDRVHSTKLVVGACWKGADGSYTEHFQGFLAGLSLLKGSTESERVIQCLNMCQENLDLTDLADMPSGTSVSFSSDMTEFSISGETVADVESLVRKVGYINYRNFPTPGRRNLKVKTTIKCEGDEEVLPEVESYVFVQHSSQPVISLSGSNIVTGDQRQFINGLDIFKDVSISVDMLLSSNEVEEVDTPLDNEVDTPLSDSVDRPLGNNVDTPLSNKVDTPLIEDVDINHTADTKSSHTAYHLNQPSLLQGGMLESAGGRSPMLLDMCTVRAEPVLDFYVEHLELPKNEIQQFNMKLEGIETAAGLVILNADTKENYERVLRNIRYIHNQESDLYMRKFVISCSSQSGRFVSNEFQVMIAEGSVDAPEDHVLGNAGHIQNSGMEQDVLHPQYQHHVAASTTTNFGMVAIIVVCVGFLLFMIVLGVLRIRAAHYRRPRQTQDGQEMEWDNSELNITVNPIDQELFDYEETGRKVSLQDVSDTDDDLSDCYHDDDDDDDDDDDESSDDCNDEVIAPKTVRKTLEWDDSNLSY